MTAIQASWLLAYRYMIFSIVLNVITSLYFPSSYAQQL